MSGWKAVKRESAIDSHVMWIVKATLKEAADRIEDAEPAPSTRLTYEGGKRRAVNLLRKMGAEVSFPWTGRRP